MNEMKTKGKTPEEGSGGDVDESDINFQAVVAIRVAEIIIIEEYVSKVYIVKYYVTKRGAVNGPKFSNSAAATKSESKETNTLSLSQHVCEVLRNGHVINIIQGDSQNVFIKIRTIIR